MVKPRVAFAVGLMVCSAWATGQRVIRLDEVAAADRMRAIEASWELSRGWEARRRRVRDHLLATLALPTLDPGISAADGRERRGRLDATVHATHLLDGYVVENISFRSFDGSRVSGNLYRPTDRDSERLPAVLSPHGHFRAHADDPEGRFRRDMQLRCATMARMGALAFAWDMVGWAESDISEHDDPAALALQTYNSVRVVDYLLSRADVDPHRIAVTGASGGGSQSFLLTAIDERIGASIPVVMVSSHFFGGCNCETGLPLHSGEEFQSNNVEIAALAAPRPMLLISCGEDWTKHTPEIEFPAIRRLYTKLSHAGRVENVHLPEEGHDYGRSKRDATYAFLARVFGLDRTRVLDEADRVDEDSVTILTREQLLCDGQGGAQRTADAALLALRQQS